ncbi:hypothetical protein ACS0TY_034450 [Phlomoides rotata]
MLDHFPSLLAMKTDQDSSIYTGGSRAMLNFGASSNSFYQLDDYFNQPEKKKRLSEDQVQFLETSFKNENKLEPERKLQLAHQLGLQPRQIAVWFQNRRARWKTKHLETEYETLHASYTSLKTDYDCLIKENQKLKAEVFHVKHDGLTQDAEKVIKSRVCDTRERVADVTSVRLSDDSCRVFEPDDGEDRLNEELLRCAYNVFPQIEEYAYSHPHSSSCGYEYDHAFSFWSY